jgi:hypothetical protein
MAQPKAKKQKILYKEDDEDHKVLCYPYCKIGLLLAAVLQAVAERRPMRCCRSPTWKTSCLGMRRPFSKQKTMSVMMGKMP